MLEPPKQPGAAGLPKHLVVVHACPDGMISILLAKWLKLMGWPTLFIVTSDRNIDCTYNLGVASALRTSHDRFVFCDNDVRPEPAGLVPFWAMDADVVGAEYRTEGGPGSWHDPNKIHSGFWRTRREVLEAMPPPWFHWHRSSDHTRTIGCVCGSFCDKARQLGFSIRHAGEVGHTPRSEARAMKRT